ncbi:MAG: hypothetical protein AAGK98_08130 [Pseudomonadota bacterium]
MSGIAPVATGTLCDGQERVWRLSARARCASATDFRKVPVEARAAVVPGGSMRGGSV